MSIKLVPRFRPHFEYSNILRLLSVPLDDIFKNIWYERCRYYTFSYGRGALLFLLKSLQIVKKKVIVPIYICDVVVDAIVQSGNMPVFIDNEKCKFTPSLSAIFSRIDSETAAIIIPHLYGFPVDIRQLYHFCKQKGIYLISDCVHTPICNIDGNSVFDYSDFILFGAAYYKIVNSINIGVLVSKTVDLDKEYAFVPTHSIFDNLKSTIFFIALPLILNPYIYRISTILFPYAIPQYTNIAIKRPTPIDINILKGQLACLRSNISLRKEVAKIYYARLHKHAELMIPHTFREEYNYSHFPILVCQRGRFIHFLNDNGIDAGTHYSKFLLNISRYSSINYDNSGFDNAKYLTEHVVNLPIDVKYGVSYAHHVANIIEDFYDGNT